jgi:hypothetical protein
MSKTALRPQQARKLEPQPIAAGRVLGGYGFKFFGGKNFGAKLANV